MSIAGLYNDGPGSTASTPLNPLRRPAPDDDDLTPSSTKRSRSRRPKRESSANRSSAHQQRLILRTKMDQTPDAVSPAPPGSGHPVLNQYADSPTGGHHHLPASRRPRPLTQHQIAVEQNRKERIDYLLAQRRADAISAFRSYRENEISSSRTRRLLQTLPDGYDTDDENSWGKGGVCPNPAEEEDYGEAAGFYQSVLRKATRRLERWDRVRLPGAGKDVVAKKAEAKRQNPKEKEKEKENGAGTPAKRPPPKRVRKSRSKAALAAAKEEAEAAAAARAAAGIEEKQRSKPSSSRSKRASGVAKAPTNGHVSSPAPARKEADDEDEQLDDIDKELLGELSDDDPPPPPPPAPRQTSRPSNGHLHAPPAPYGDESSVLDGDGYASSSEHEDHRGGDEDLDDVESSVFYGRNGGHGASGSVSDDARAGGGGHGVDEDDGDELMLGA